MYDEDLSLMRKICDAAKEAGVGAVIACDHAVLEYAKKIGQNVHLSTQASVSNMGAVCFYASYANVIVLARELKLEQIEYIIKQISSENVVGPSGELVRIEIFGHGALCVAISGKCTMSLAQYNSSANRGACLQACRREYTVTDKETGDQLDIDNEYIMSPKDLCTIGFLDKLISAGIGVLKIEGRGRAPEYVATVVRCYREARDAIAEGTYTKEKISSWHEELSKVFNRGFWHGGYYLGKKLGDWSGEYGSHVKRTKNYVGKVTNYYAKSGVGEVLIQSGEVKAGDKFLVTGPTTGVIEGTIEEIRTDDKKEIAEKGDVFTFSVKKVRANDKFYIYSQKSLSS
ncbi:U32 family peptidase [Candidatus Woesearchaeota archaeon]|nr:U32 family peptidase [Candidatus Woesearchaeota archaeon]